jgi:hypothetical protein
VHGVVVWFHFLKEPESPNDIFTLLLTRIPREKLPGMFFYDNGCKLYEYILNREPWMLKNLRIIVDSFHYGSWRSIPVHKCPHSFDTKANPVAALFNSQYEEHGNAYVSIHKRSARTMGFERAHTLIGVLLQCWNSNKFNRTESKQSAFEAQYKKACEMLGWGTIHHTQ